MGSFTILHHPGIISKSAPFLKIFNTMIIACTNRQFLKKYINFFC